MIGDAFVFDGVAHPFNFTEKNVYDRAGEMFRQHLYAFHQVLTPDTEPKLSAEQYLKDWTLRYCSAESFGSVSGVRTWLKA